MKKNYQKGITLIELMITVAIIGIIAAVAYPSYQAFMEKARRADGQAALMAFAAAMERHFTVNDTYATTVSGSTPTAPLASVFEDEAPLDGNDKYYDLVVQSATATAFEIRAIPKNAQSNDDCKTLTLTHTGARGLNGSSLNSSDCWE